MIPSRIIAGCGRTVRSMVSNPHSPVPVRISDIHRLVLTPINFTNVHHQVTTNAATHPTHIPSRALSFPSHPSNPPATPPFPTPSFRLLPMSLNQTSTAAGTSTLPTLSSPPASMTHGAHYHPPLHLPPSARPTALRSKTSQPAMFPWQMIPFSGWCTEGWCM
jgi:hypothetical protein